MIAAKQIKNFFIGFIFFYPQPMGLLNKKRVGCRPLLTGLARSLKRADKQPTVGERLCLAFSV